MIGGFGSDQLIGNAEDDILIGGTTDYDANAPVLRDILTVWQGSGTYQARVAAMQTGANKLLADVTVHDDGAVDQLTGSAGSDWFFANADGPGVHDVITDLGNSETLSDVDP